MQQISMSHWTDCLIAVQLSGHHILNFLQVRCVCLFVRVCASVSVSVCVCERNREKREREKGREKDVVHAVKMVMRINP